MTGKYSLVASMPPAGIGGCPSIDTLAWPMKLKPKIGRDALDASRMAANIE